MTAEETARRITDAFFDRNDDHAEFMWLGRREGVGSVMIGGLSREDTYALILEILNGSR